MSQLRTLFFAVFCITCALVPEGICGPTASDAPGLTRLDELLASVSKTIEIEKADLEELKRRQRDILNDLKTQEKELRVHKLELSAAENLALIETVPLKDLEKTRAMVSQTLNYSSERTGELKKLLEELSARISELEERLNTNKNRISQLRKQEDGSLPSGLLNSLRDLDKIFESKHAILLETKKAISESLSEWQEVYVRSSRLISQLNQLIAKKKEKQLFERQDKLITHLKPGLFIEDIRVFVNTLRKGLSKDFWRNQVLPLLTTGGSLVIAFLIAYVLVIIVLMHCRDALLNYANNEYRQRNYPWLCRSILIFFDSLPLLGTLLFSYFYISSRKLLETYAVSRFAISCLVTWLLTSWVIKFLRLLKGQLKGETAEFLRKHARLSASGVRWFTLVYLFIQYLLPPENTLLFAYRLLLEIFALAWFVYLLNRMGRIVSRDANSVFQRKPWLYRIIVFWGYVVTLTGLVSELLGYQYLAVFWYAGWGRTLVVSMWVFLGFAVLMQWEKVAETSAAFAPTDQTEARKSIKWLTIKILWVGWLLMALVSYLVAWKAEKAVIWNFFGILNRPIRILGFTFRLSSIVYAILIITVTQVANRWIRRAIRDHALGRSGLDEGLQESIVTITGYLVWFFAIIMILNTLGVSGTSLTVAFGALGVGLGFGLQNIFNNFVSGLILLFERPIQVGDIVEVEGTWGEVKKINVRSTVVQTWDNASVIIPNSALVSERVTNWSFRDARVRRNIDVGVAYGSDVILVRDTLMEIANNHPAVFREPEPSVLFVDFGDNALIFRLRVWTTVRKSLEVETEIRYEITRLFSERGIEIAFPQRDIHIRSIGPLEKLFKVFASKAQFEK
ncbi:mechanosensitive ion channel domain-containing protein [Thermodesulforhabdus norvegica]|uniref:Small-conductance mechanosensitive channel n=1 Tax=Thermodesulforhabdus norvegica TaxID=39841 RepID=A0A1I4VA18_9BACT|nr:mechanosensitive ion channel domain-containing protein [Thermodesulforhabdus norvegica]SFM98025.1 Small-conductance mechanosensitive channel [Thermodesulforhabdus norvegica]